MTVFSFGAGTDTGNVREHNEDNYYFNVESAVWAVADGMGGHAGGEVASGIAKQAIKDSIGQGDDVEKAIHRSHLAILEAIENGEGKDGMGTTLVAVQFDGSDFKLAWVGDSRAYLWDPEESNPDERLKQISHDQSLVQMMVDAGAITPEQARKHPKKNIITQYVGQPEVDDLKIDVVESTLQPAQKLILCSDGLNDELTNAEIAGIINLAKHTGDSDQDIAEELIAAALRNGGHDNVTVIVISLQ